MQPICGHRNFRPPKFFYPLATRLLTLLNITKLSERGNICPCKAILSFRDLFCYHYGKLLLARYSWKESYISMYGAWCFSSFDECCHNILNVVASHEIPSNANLYTLREVALKLHASYSANITKKQTPLVIFDWLYSKIWTKRLYVGFLTELQARVSRGCRFLLFLHHNYQVSLI